MQKFVDRLEEALERGVIRLVDDEDAPRELRLSVQQWSTILMVLIPEEFPADPPPAEPTTFYPGSSGKKAVMEERRKNGLSLYSDADTPMAEGRYVPRGAGSGRNRRNHQAID